jgi:hypothetical protein
VVGDPETFTSAIAVAGRGTRELVIRSRSIGGELELFKSGVATPGLLGCASTLAKFLASFAIGKSKDRKEKIKTKGKTGNKEQSVRC